MANETRKQMTVQEMISQAKEQGITITGAESLAEGGEAAPVAAAAAGVPMDKLKGAMGNPDQSGLGAEPTPEQIAALEKDFETKITLKFYEVKDSRSAKYPKASMDQIAEASISVMKGDALEIADAMGKIHQQESESESRGADSEVVELHVEGESSGEGDGDGTPSDLDSIFSPEGIDSRISSRA